ncbi:MFS transporter [Pediococcus pentosaceus]|uniref:MFS transporter n=1 Tax=Pediococcus pentosaceus TaxID=1255 RepID=UPI0022E64F84|nr:MFS transporter [Pediococcus pentosaceus]
MELSNAKADRIGIKNILFIFFISFILVLPQIMNKSIILGADSIFHFNRFYDTYMQFRTGNFSYFQTNFGFQQSGRIINALYGPLLAYGMGALLYIVHSWLKFQVLTSFFVFFLSGYTMNVLAVKVGSSRRVANITSVLFMGSFWVGKWTIDQNFMSIGNALMPLIVLMGIKMLKNDEENLRVLQLALCVSLVIQVHLLSAAIAIGVLLSFFVVSIVKNDNKLDLFFKCVKAALLSLILTFNVWWALIEVYTGNSLYGPYPSNLAKSAVNLSLDKPDFWHLGLAVSALFLVQISLLVVHWTEFTVINKVTTILGTILLVLASNLFPWEFVDNNYPVIKTFLQFPARFETMAFILLVLGLNLSILEIKTRISTEILTTFTLVISLLGVIQTYGNIQNLSVRCSSGSPVANKTNVIFKSNNDSEIKKAFRSNNLKRGLKIVEKPTPDYMPMPNLKSKAEHSYAQYNEDFISTKNQTSKKVRGNILVISWHASKVGSKKKIPITLYKNSILTLNGKKISKNEMKLDRMSVPTIVSDKKGKNVVKLEYKSKIVSKVSLSAMYMCWGISLVSYTFGRRKRHEVS